MKAIELFFLLSLLITISIFSYNSHAKEINTEHLNEISAEAATLPYLSADRNYSTLHIDKNNVVALFKNYTSSYNKYGVVHYDLDTSKVYYILSSDSDYYDCTSQDIPEGYDSETTDCETTHLCDGDYALGVDVRGDYIVYYSKNVSVTCEEGTHMNYVLNDDDDVSETDTWDANDPEDPYSDPSNFVEEAHTAYEKQHSYKVVLHQISTGTETTISEDVDYGSSLTTDGQKVCWAIKYDNNMSCYDIATTTTETIENSNITYLESISLESNSLFSIGHGPSTSTFNRYKYSTSSFDIDENIKYANGHLDSDSIITRIAASWANTNYEEIYYYDSNSGSLDKISLSSGFSLLDSDVTLIADLRPPASQGTPSQGTPVETNLKDVPSEEMKFNNQIVSLKVIDKPKDSELEAVKSPSLEILSSLRIGYISYYSGIYSVHLWEDGIIKTLIGDDTPKSGIALDGNNLVWTFEDSSTGYNYVKYYDINTGIFKTILK